MVSHAIFEFLPAKSGNPRKENKTQPATIMLESQECEPTCGGLLPPGPPCTAPVQQVKTKGTSRFLWLPSAAAAASLSWGAFCHCPVLPGQLSFSLDMAHPDLSRPFMIWPLRTGVPIHTVRWPLPQGLGA